MPMSNPSAVLVARSSRSPNNLSAALSSPTETHAAAAGIFRSSASSPPWSFEEFEGEDVSELEVDDDEEATEAIETDETFTRRARYPGTVKIVVEKTTFWSEFPTSLLTVRELTLVSGLTERSSSSRHHSSKLHSAEGALTI
jgi:hypothetical protein